MFLARNTRERPCLWLNSLTTFLIRRLIFWKATKICTSTWRRSKIPPLSILTRRIRSHWFLCFWSSFSHIWVLRIFRRLRSEVWTSRVVSIQLVPTHPWIKSSIFEITRIMCSDSMVPTEQLKRSTLSTASSTISMFRPKTVNNNRATCFLQFDFSLNLNRSLNYWQRSR